MKDRNEHKDILILFGEQVKTVRERLALTQEDLASLMNVDRSYIGMIERAEKNITIIGMKKFMKALGIKFWIFFQEIDL
jgi:transcriptional regulator with XRE-family HTH domain